MKKILSFLTIQLFATLILIGCRKNDVMPDNSYDKLLGSFAAPVQLFTINAASGGSITGSGGTILTFPANALVNMDGSAFTGDAIVMLEENLKKSQWFVRGLSATAQNDILISGGMLNIEVRRKDNGAELKPAPAMERPASNINAVIKAEVPKNKNVNRDLQLFLPDSTNGQPTVPVTQAPVGWTAASYYPFGNGTNSYIFQIPKFRWVNCDGLYNQPGTKTTVKITPDLSANPGATQMQGILVYRNLSTVITFPPKTGYFESYSNSIPVGSVADVVCIGKTADGKILFKVLPSTTITASMNISITPVVADASVVSAYLNSIDQ